ncbi:MAG: hypothetical protein RLZZ501_1138 [Pseudomonadota bacterium]|jgi:multidrug efflux system membrane fusion protein
MTDNPARRPSRTTLYRWSALAGLAVFGLGLALLAWPAGQLDAQPAPPPGGPPGGPGAAQAQTVSVATAEARDLPVVLTGLGTVTPLATVTVKSQISGYLTRVAFSEGQTVKRGALLAEVDSRPYQALLAQYQGTLAKDQAQLDNARRDLARYRTLAAQDSISGQNLDTQAATVRQYEGVVKTDQAQVETQKINIDYCHITSPIDGRVGLRQVDAGNYVTASDSSGLVVVTQMTPISVLFTLPEDNLPQIRARLRAGASLPVAAYDRANSTKLADGTLATLDNQIDTSTGTVKLRAIFANADDALFPNQFVNARLLVDTVKGAVTVPLAAVRHGSGGDSLYVVEDGNVAHLRNVETGRGDGDRIAITRGLALGERVVTDGADRLRDGAKVKVAAPGQGK